MEAVSPLYLGFWTVAVSYLSLFSLAAITIYFFIKDKAFLYYALYCLFNLLYLLTKLNGDSFLFSEDSLSPEMQLNLNWYVQVLFHASYAVFAYYLLDFQNLPIKRRALTRGIFLVNVNACTVVFLVSTCLGSTFFVDFFFFFFIPLMFVLFLMNLRQGLVLAGPQKYFLLAGLLIFIGSAFTALYFSIQMKGEAFGSSPLSIDPLIFFIWGVIIENLFFTGGLLYKIKMISDRSKNQQEQILKLSYEKSISNLNSVLLGENRERERIAQELHDGLGIKLSMIRRKINNYVDEDRDAIEIDELVTIGDELGKACTEVRTISHQMMPDALVNLGLTAAVEDLVLDVRNNYDIDVQLDMEDELEISKDASFQVYRIIQECINNSLKYAEASLIKVSLLPVSIEGLVKHKLLISDDGKGFDISKAGSAKSLGLKNIRSRVGLLKGEVSLNSSEGTKYEIVF